MLFIKQIKKTINGVINSIKDKILSLFKRKTKRKGENNYIYDFVNCDEMPNAKSFAVFNKLFDFQCNNINNINVRNNSITFTFNLLSDNANLKNIDDNVLLLFFCKHASYIVHYINANKTALVFDNTLLEDEIRKRTGCNKKDCFIYLPYTTDKIDALISINDSFFENHDFKSQLTIKSDYHIRSFKSEIYKYSYKSIHQMGIELCDKIDSFCETYSIKIGKLDSITIFNYTLHK